MDVLTDERCEGCAAGDRDGNDRTDVVATYAPFIIAPCFPSYPSAHASASNAAREVLERIYGPGGHDITFENASLPGVTLHYTALKRITEDVDDARVYGGIHFRFDQEAGSRQRQRVGEYVFKHVPMDVRLPLVRKPGSIGKARRTSEMGGQQAALP